MFPFNLGIELCANDTCGDYQMKRLCDFMMTYDNSPRQEIIMNTPEYIPSQLSPDIGEDNSHNDCRLHLFMDTFEDLSHCPLALFIIIATHHQLANDPSTLLN